MELAVRIITNCRLCNSADMTPLYSLGDQYVSNFVDFEHINSGIKCPIEMVLCNVCRLAQLKHTAPQEILYARKYWYQSGTTDTMKAALQNVVASAMSKVKLQPGDVVLDIGSNDGTLLRCYPNRVPVAYQEEMSDPGECIIMMEGPTPNRFNLTTVGVEPATNLTVEGRKGIDHFINDFWSFSVYEKMWRDWENVKCIGRVGGSPTQKAKIITAIGMFYDLDNPNQFVGDVAKALVDDGIFVAQLMCLKNMVAMKDVGNLAHEHLEYYTLASLGTLFNRNGLTIFDIETNNVNGQSYRLYACKNVSINTKPLAGYQRVWEALKVEWEMGIEKPPAHIKWFAELVTARDRVVNFIKREVSAGKKVWVYGASTKGNVILQWYGLDASLITGAADKDPNKWGKYTIGTGIPIMSEENARLARPDYFLVLPYAFIDEFVHREKQWMTDGATNGSGGSFILPISPDHYRDPVPVLMSYNGQYIVREPLI